MTIWKPHLAIDDTPRYLAIANAIETDIQQGRLVSGTRLPPHRELADFLSVTIGTVTRGYGEAARRGLIRGETGRGSYVLGETEARSLPNDVEDLPTSAVDLGLTLPLHRLDPDLGSCLRELSTSPSNQQLIRYFPSKGRRVDREAGVAWLERYGVRSHPDQVVVCGGGQSALAAVLAALFKYGDSIAIETYTYPLFNSLARRLGFRLAPIEQDNEGMLPESLAQACRSKKLHAIYCMPRCQNPTNAHMSLKRKKAIVALAQEYNLQIIEDEAYGLLAEESSPPIATLAPERTFFIGSFSKAIAAGLRVAYLHCPAKFANRAEQSLADLSYMSAPLCAEIARRWIENGTADTTVALKRKESAARVSLARKKLRRFTFRVQPTSYFLWLQLPENWSGSDFAREAAANNLFVTPDDSFRFGRASERSYVRLALSAPHDIDSLSQGLDTVVEILRQ